MIEKGTYDITGLSESFQALLGSPQLMGKLFDSFPLMIEVFDSDGTSVYVNQAALDFNGISDASLIVGKYNALDDEVIREVMGPEFIERAFRGDFVPYTDFSVPIDNLVERGVTEVRPFENAFLNIFSLPLWDKGILKYVFMIFLPKQMYRGKPEIARAQTYMYEHWVEKFDREKTAASANLSVSHFSRIFKQHIGVSPHGFYKQIKIEKIKEKLREPGMTVTQAFSECGVESKGIYFRYFKELVGMTPTEYQKSENN